MNGICNAAHLLFFFSNKPAHLPFVRVMQGFQGSYVGEIPNSGSSLCQGKSEKFAEEGPPEQPLQDIGKLPGLPVMSTLRIIE